MTHIITESEVENVVLDILSELGYEKLYGPDIAFDGKAPERIDYTQVVLTERLRKAVSRINPNISQETKEEVIKKSSEPRAQNSSLIIMRSIRCSLTALTQNTEKKGGLLAIKSGYLILIIRKITNFLLSINSLSSRIISTGYLTSSSLSTVCR